MKEKILKLRSEGKTYKQISRELGCSTGTICYHCGEGQVEKNRNKLRKRRKEKVLQIKVERFQNKKIRTLSEKSRSFQRREGSLLGPIKEYTYTYNELLEKIGSNPKCYLTGKPIDLDNPKTYHLDHIIPATKGGSNNIDNIGLLEPIVNKMKHDLMIDEFIDKCIQILEYQGYEIRKRGE